MDRKFTLKDYEQMVDDVLKEFMDAHKSQYDLKDILQAKAPIQESNGNLPVVQ